LRDNNSNIITDKTYDLLDNNSKTFTDYSYNNLLTTEETNITEAKTYIITYIATDIEDNSREAERTITVEINVKIILKPQIVINNVVFNLNDNFNIEIQNHKTNNPNSIINNFDISYDSTNSLITYEATTIEDFNDYIDFSFEAQSIIEDSTITKLNPINNIVPNDTNNIFTIIFQAFDNNFESETETIKFKVVDNIPPTLIIDVSFNMHNYFKNELNTIDNTLNNIELPVISNNVSSILYNDINNYINTNNLELYNNYFALNSSNQVIYNIPGIEINDIVSGKTITLSNETIDISFNTNYSLDVSYSDISYTTYNHNQLLTICGEYIQTYRVYDENGNISYISRNLTVKYFKPFILLNYPKDINGNEYNKIFYHEVNLYYEDLGGTEKDYYFPTTDLSFSIIKNINVNLLEEQNLEYNCLNVDIPQLNANIIRKVHVVKIDTLKALTPGFDFFNTYINDNNKKLGVYNGSYNIVIENSNNAINLSSSYDYDVSNIINLTSDSSFISTDSDNNKTRFYYGNITLKVNGNFQYIDLIYYDESSERNISTIKDLFIYHKASQIIQNNDIFNKLPDNVFDVDISNINRQVDASAGQYFILNDKRQQNLHLCTNKYVFKQNFKLNNLTKSGGFKNFYNTIRFSYLPDGHHFNKTDLSNGKYDNYVDPYTKNYWLEHFENQSIDNISFTGINDTKFNKYNYTKNVNYTDLPGFSNSKTEIIIDTATPSPLYYYSEKFPHMGGKIECKNNILLTKDTIGINGNVLNYDNSNVYQHVDYLSVSDISNKIFLSAHYDISYDSEFNPTINDINDRYNIKQNKHFIGLTQQNIIHNMVLTKDKNKIIFKKYENIEDFSNNNNTSTIQKTTDTFDYGYLIKEDNSNNYLYDISSNNFTNNIIYYDFKIDTSANLLASKNEYSNSYELAAEQLFFDNFDKEYKDFLVSNKIDNINLYLTDFIYKINEMKYNNHVELKNNGEDFLFYSDTYLNSSRLIFDNIFDNLISFNLQVYLDRVKLENEITNSRKLNYLFNNIFNKNIENSNYVIDQNNLFFQEFVVTIFSDISGHLRQVEDISSIGITFNKNVIELTDNLIDSSNNKNILNNVIKDISSSVDLKDLVFLSLKPNENPNDSSINFVGLTQQNIYHNMFIDENDNIFFHSYDENINNYQVNSSNLTLEKTINDNSNSNNFLITISNNDVYNCFINTNDASFTIYNNVPQKNDIQFDICLNNNSQALNQEYKLSINYYTKNELSNNEIILEDLLIDSIGLNQFTNTKYNEFPYAYPKELQELHSHTYKIDLLDFIDRNFYNNTKSNNKLPYSMINYSNLTFIIKDISYTKIDFGIYDLEINQLIMHDKTKIEKLKKLEKNIHLSNIYVNNILNVIIDYNNKNNEILFDGLNFDDFIFINSSDFDNLTDIYKDISYVSTAYLGAINSDSLNQIYNNVFYNIKSLIKKNNYIVETLEDQNLEILNIITNIYEDIASTSNFDSIQNKIDIVNSNIDNILENIYDFTYTDYSDSSNIIVLQKPEDFVILNRIYQEFTEIKDNYFKIRYELSFRDENLGLLIEPLNIDNSFTGLDTINDTQDFVTTLLTDLSNLNNFINYDLSNLDYSLRNENDDPIQDRNKYIFIDNSYNINPNNYDFIDLSNQFNNIANKFDTYLRSINIIFSSIGIENKNLTFDQPINYVMSGTELLINSYYSNNIIIKFELKYNSYLYTDISLDKFVLDLAIPDFTPPTLIFNNDDLSVNLSNSTEGNIETLINNLIKDISFVGLNVNELSYNDLSNITSTNDISYSYYDISSTQINSNVINYPILELDLDIIGTTDISGDFIDVSINYIIRDFANNTNTIPRNIRVNKAFDKPLFQYFDFNISNYVTITINKHPFDLIINPNDSDDLIKNRAKNNIRVIDRPISDTTYLDLDTNLEIIIIRNTDNEPEQIKYIATSERGTNYQTTLLRDIVITNTAIEDEIDKVCCYPKVYYKPFVDTYKLGSSNTTAMRLSKLILKNIKFKN
jgi:hypothetical protein